MFNLVEEFPSVRPSHALKLGAIAACVVLSTIAGYILLNPQPPVPAGEVLDVKLYTPPPQEMAADGRVVLASVSLPNQAGQPNPTLLVLTPVKIHNTSDKPFSILDLAGVVRLGNKEYQSADVSAADFPKVFRYYPDLASYRQPPLLRHEVIQPGATATGLLVFNYPLTEDQWDKRASFQVKVSFDRGRDIVLVEPDTSDASPKLTADTQ
jgi:hypothetical protein